MPLLVLSLLYFLFISISISSSHLNHPHTLKKRLTNVTRGKHEYHQTLSKDSYRVLKQTESASECVSVQTFWMFDGSGGIDSRQSGLCSEHRSTCFAMIGWYNCVSAWEVEY
ncbi:hypothetical protein BO71DRAFT_127286 [Aspergillus ellipticus CBS 707.79]|uniref:Secreted protein n=1 Tax=Aspergillus ellipticus CBS 707.79 TaxID=1448320 RepID=A0A319CU40_9EURO|nr:hypothetical protein BO71DRAFT_127286 [Aspergillus ellipticus CBS 707.79]